MKLLPWIGLAAAAAVLASCSKPAEKGATESAAAPAAAATSERAGPVTWDTKSGAFMLAGKPLPTAKLWKFEGSSEGFTAMGSKIAPAAPQGLSVTVADPTLRSPKGLAITGAQYPLVLVRITRTAPGTLWDGALYYKTASHPEAATFFGKPVSGANPAVGETTTLVYDMAKQTVGGADWTQSTIDQIRLDIEDKPGGAFTILQVAIAGNPDGVALTPPAPAAPAPKP